MCTLKSTSQSAKDTLSAAELCEQAMESDVDETLLTSSIPELRAKFRQRGLDLDAEATKSKLP